MRWSNRGGGNLSVDIAADQRGPVQAVPAEKLVKLRAALAGLDIHLPPDLDPSVDLLGWVNALLAAAESVGRAKDPDYEQNTGATAASEGAAPVSMSLNHPRHARPSPEESQRIVEEHFGARPWYDGGRGPRPGA